MTSLVRAPPEPFAPVVEEWPEGLEMFRIHTAARGASEFNPGHAEPTRFAFFGEPPVPVLYAGEIPEAAVAETLLHDVGTDEGFLAHESYRGRALTGLVPRRALRLVQLHSGGLLKLRVEPRQLTATTATHYGDTVAWAAAAYRSSPDVDGLVWMSRRWNSARSLVLFGDRVAPSDLDVVAPPLHRFDRQESFAWLARLCWSVGVDVQPPPSSEWPATFLAELSALDVADD